MAQHNTQHSTLEYFQVVLEVLRRSNTDVVVLLVVNPYDNSTPKDTTLQDERVVVGSTVRVPVADYMLPLTAGARTQGEVVLEVLRRSTSSALQVRDFYYSHDDSTPPKDTALQYEKVVVGSTVRVSAVDYMLPPTAVARTLEYFEVVLEVLSSEKYR